MVILEGIIKSENPIYSKTFESFFHTPLIYKITYTKEVFSLDKIDPDIKAY